VYFLADVKLSPNCSNRNHSHDRGGPCANSSWIPRHDCYYCEDYGYGNGSHYLKNECDPCGHYDRKGL